MSLDAKNVISSNQCRAARALIGWNQDQLATASKVAKKTIADFERESGRTPYERTLADIQAALETAGVIFIPSNGEGLGVRLRKQVTIVT